MLSCAKYISPFYLLRAEVLTPLCDFSTSKSELHISKINHCNYLSSAAAGGVKAKLICTFSPLEWVFENKLLRTLNFDSVFLDPLIVWDNWGLWNELGNFTYFSKTPNHSFIFIRILIESYRVSPQGWSVLTNNLRKSLKTRGLEFRVNTFEARAQEVSIWLLWFIFRRQFLTP